MPPGKAKSALAPHVISRKLRAPHNYALRATLGNVRERFGDLSDDILLTEHETSCVVGYTAGTLKFWRLNNKGKGPPCVRMPGTDAVRYRVGSLRKWLAAITEQV